MRSLKNAGESHTRPRFPKNDGGGQPELLVQYLKISCETATTGACAKGVLDYEFFWKLYKFFV